MADKVDVEDGPNDKGEMFEQPGKLTDPILRPYANIEAGRAADGDALSPYLSFMKSTEIWRVLINIMNRG